MPARGRRLESRTEHSFRRLAFDGAPFLPDEPFELVEQAAIAVRNSVDERRQNRKRLAAAAHQEALHELGRHGPVELVPCRGWAIHERTPNLPSAEQPFLEQP